MVDHCCDSAAGSGAQEAVAFVDIIMLECGIAFFIKIWFLGCILLQGSVLWLESVALQFY